MFIYNVTIKVDWRIHDAWLLWMREHHMPAVLATGCFVKAQLLRLLELEDEEGQTYAAQYYAASKSDYERYLADFSAALRNEGFQKWGNLFIAFRSVMEIVN